MPHVALELYQPAIGHDVFGTMAGYDPWVCGHSLGWRLAA
jgi:hypothetical protein